MKRLAVLDTSYGDVLVEEAAASRFGVIVTDARESTDSAALDGVLVQYATITAAEMDANPSWKVIGRYGVGVDTIDIEAASSRGIAVVNVPDYCTEEVATHAAAMVLAVNRKLPQADALVRAGRWMDWSEIRDIRPLSECTLGLVGVGRIGREVIRLLVPLVDSVIAFDPVGAPDQAADLVDLETVFRQADILSLHCPLTPETRHIVDRASLDMMKPSAVIVNVSRGGLVDADALAEALRTGKLAGAAVDVMAAEPPDADDPLLSAPNVIVTNHIAWYSQASETRLRHLLAERCAAVLLGDHVASIVNATQLAGMANP